MIYPKYGFNNKTKLSFVFFYDFDSIKKNKD